MMADNEPESTCTSADSSRAMATSPPGRGSGDAIVGVLVSPAGA